MKEIRRDFTLVVDVPDFVNPEDCEIVIDVASASYWMANVTPRIIAEDPYEALREEPDASDQS